MKHRDVLIVEAGSARLTTAVQKIGKLEWRQPVGLHSQPL
jgi:hypothetical protein